MSMRAAEKRLDGLHHDGLLSTPAWEKLKPSLTEQLATLAGALCEVMRDKPALEAEERDIAQRELLRAQRAALLDLRHDGVISEDVFDKVAAEVEVVALAGGRRRYRRILMKAVAAALSIGSGASVGPEDPSVQIGANLGSMFGQWFRLSEEPVRTQAATGAAGGIAAAFTAPIAGIFFAARAPNSHSTW